MKKFSKLLVGLVMLFALWFSSCNVMASEKPAQYTKLKNGLQVGSLEAFISTPVRKKSVLVTELTSMHHECVPGYAKYFLDLGYNVDVLVTKKHANCFNLFEKNKKLRVYSFAGNNNIYENELILRKKFAKYKHVLLNSEYRFEPIRRLKIFDVPNSIIVTHTTNVLKKDAYKKHVQSNRIVTLGDFGKAAYVNPHYFGKIKEHTKNEKTNFVVVGGVQSYRRNYDLLIKAITGLKKKKLNFSVTLVGWSGKLKVSDEIKDCVIRKGRLSYPDMYKEVENADFMVMLLDPNHHQKYKKHMVTGNSQLSYGFAKPPLIAQEFADFYKYNSKNAVIYENNDLRGAMEKAIKCSKDTYSGMTANLRETAKSIFQKSLQNLKGVVKC